MFKKKKLSIYFVASRAKAFTVIHGANPKVFIFLFRGQKANGYMIESRNQYLLKARCTQICNLTISGLKL